MGHAHHLGKIAQIRLAPRLTRFPARSRKTRYRAFRCSLNRFSDGLLHQVGLSDLTFVEATLKTGRTHQIRVHLQSQDCPIAGDERYGDYQANKRLQKLGLKRMFLHASELHLAHPLTGEKLILKAPLPQELAQFVVMLENQEKAV